MLTSTAGVQGRRNGSIAEETVLHHNNGLPLQYGRHLRRQYPRVAQRETAMGIGQRPICNARRVNTTVCLGMFIEAGRN